MKMAENQTIRADLALATDTPDESIASSSDEYNAVVEKAQLVDVLMIGCAFKMVPKYFDVSTKEFQFNLEKATVLPNDDSGVARGAFHWVVKATSGEEVILELAATFMVLYTSLKGLSSKAVEAFVRRIGPFTTYPYFRAHVSNISWMSKANLPILPVLTEDNLGPVPESE